MNLNKLYEKHLRAYNKSYDYILYAIIISAIAGIYLWLLEVKNIWLWVAVFLPILAAAVYNRLRKLVIEHYMDKLNSDGD